MKGFNLPYQPIPQRLYTGTDLFSGFDPKDPLSWEKTDDFKIYRHFVLEGRTTPNNPYMGMMQALHDNAISDATINFIHNRKVTAIVGGHDLRRDAPAYHAAAIIARLLTLRGYLVVTGGGPGAMEAGHLGAALAFSQDSSIEAALSRLQEQPLVPDLRKIVNPRGKIDRGLVAEAQAWFRPAYELAQEIKHPAESLAIPTWHYGHEPSSPFATHIAKYFQNSLREDGLLAIAREGIICMEGIAGTIQEIFQEATPNYYATFGHFSPMVFFGREYWTKTYPVVAVLKQMFKKKFDQYMLVTDDVDSAVGFIKGFEKSQ